MDFVYPCQYSGEKTFDPIHNYDDILLHRNEKNLQHFPPSVYISIYKQISHKSSTCMMEE